MKKLFAIALVLLPFAAITQPRQDTVAAVLIIKRCNTCPLQPVSGYVVFNDCNPVAYLSGKKRPYPSKFRVCNETDFYNLKNRK